MGMTVTTSNGSRDSEGNLDWIYDPVEVDGDAIGLSWSASAMSVCDALVAANIAEENQMISGLEMPIKEADDKLQAALTRVDPEDDYLVPRLIAIDRVIRTGLSHGATHLIAD